jgi:hypothetical protein
LRNLGQEAMRRSDGEAQSQALDEYTEQARKETVSEEDDERRLRICSWYTDVHSHDMMST